MKRRGRLAAPSFFATAAQHTPSAADDPTPPPPFHNQLRSCHESVSGSASTSASHFGYSQKNFHTSDGNLYSVLSPLQGQRSRARPPFPRHQQQTTTTEQQQQQSSSNQRWRLLQREDNASRRWKEEAEEEEEGWFNRRINRDDVDSLFDRWMQRSPSPVFHSSRWPEQQRLDISSIFKSKLSSTDAASDHLFERRSSWSDDDDDDDEEETDAPLNLCLADRRRRRKSSSSSSKSDLEEHHQRRRRRHHSSHDFNHYSSFFKSDFLLDETKEEAPPCSSSSSRHFRMRRRADTEEEVKADNKTAEKSNNRRVLREVEEEEEEPTVLDLSMKNLPRLPEVSVDGDSSNQDKWSQAMDTGEWLKHPSNRKNFPRISEMLEKMQLRDSDEWRAAMQMDSYRAALESTRERLIHSHPDMFLGWPPPPSSTPPATSSNVQITPKVHLNKPQHFYKQQQPLVVSATATSGAQQTTTTTIPLKREDANTCLPPLRSCSAVSISSGGGQQQQQPLAASSSCPEVPSLSDGHGARCGVKSKWSLSKGERVKGRPPRKLSGETQSSNTVSPSSSSASPFANDISICKFKLVKGLHPVLEEKKTLHVPMPLRSSPSSSPHRSNAEVNDVINSSGFRFNPTSNDGAGLETEAGGRTLKLHVDGGVGATAVGRRPAAASPGGLARRTRKRSRKTLAREQLEATFREQGFLIKTQQVASEGGAVYCKFRQLKKFTRYLFKSWKDHLPLDLQEQSGLSPATAAAAAAAASDNL